MNRIPSAGAVTLIALLTVAGVSAGATALVLAPHRPATLGEGSDPQTFPLTTEDFDDQRTVDVTVNTTDGTHLAAPVSGRITAWGCAAGGTIESGHTMMSVDDQPILSLATSMPLWRDLASGDHGTDVSSLQTELARLGEPVDIDGALGAETITAFNDLLHRLGGNAETDGIPLARVQWIPSPSVALASCTASLGARIEEGDDIATLPGGVTQLTIESYPKDLYPGDRVITINGIDVPVDPDGRVSSEGVALLGDVVLTRSTEGNDPATFSAALRLAENVLVAPIPPSALYDLTDRTGCVTADSRPRAVRVAGSQLGQTFVVFEGTTPAEVDVDPRSSAPCR